MLLIVVIALTIVLCILSIHYYQHFQFQLKTRRRNRSISRLNSRSRPNIIETQMSLLRTTHCKFKCCFQFVPVDDQEFDFFPMAFLLYLVFIAILCLLIIVIEIINYSDDLNNESTLDFLFGYSSQSYNNNSFTTFHRLHHINTTTIIDYILVYSTILLFIWVSLFSFYRYYTTFISLTQMQSASIKRLFTKFAIYAAIFCIIILFQIHVYYYLFPIVIILFCAFNWYCTYKFAEMLTASVKLFISFDVEDLGAKETSNECMLNSIIFTKHISIICCILQSINLSIFVMTYDVNILGYLSFLWSVSGFILALNFVRTRNCMKYQLFKCKQRYKKVQTRQVTPIQKHPKNVSTEQIGVAKYGDQYHNINNAQNNEMIAKKPPLQHKVYSQSVEYKVTSPKPLMLRSKSDPLVVSLYPEDSDEQTYSIETVDITPKQRTIRSKSNPPNMEKDIDPKITRRSTVSVYMPPIPVEETKIRDNDEESETLSTKKTAVTLQLPGTIEKTPSISDVSVTRSRKHNKALDLLGITASVSKHGDYSVTSPLYTVDKSSQVPEKHSSKSPESKLYKLSQLKEQITSSRSKYVSMDSDEESKSTPVPTSKAIALEIPISSMNGIEIENMEMTKSDSVVGSILDQHTPQFIVDPEEDYGDAVHRNEFKEKHERDDTISTTISKEGPSIPRIRTIHHIQSHSQPIEIDEMFLSLNMLAKYGFCSRKSINSMRQLEEYQRKLTPIPQ